MMAEITTSSTPSKTRKLLLQASLGGIVGFAASYFGFAWIEDTGFELDDGSDIFALGTALVMALMGGLVLIGGLAPRLGAATLNVEDEEEIRDERPLLILAGLIFLLLALFLGLLVLGGGDTPIVDSRTAGTAVIVVAAVFLPLNVWSYRFVDELTLAMTKDATLIATSVFLLLFGAWAALAEFGQVLMFQALDFISGFLAIYLVSVFIVAGKRGLLKPR